MTTVDWSIYARCGNCPARAGEPCTGTEWLGSYATGDYRVHIGELSKPHVRQTMIEFTNWQETYARYLADTLTAVRDTTGAEITVSSDSRFWLLTVGRWSAYLPICVCEIDGMTGRTGTCAKLGAGDVGGALGHGGACDAGQGERPCHGWHTSHLIALVERVRRPAKVATTRKASVPRAPKGDPTPEQVAAIMARHGLSPEGAPLG